MQSLKICRLINGDVSVDGHTDDDVDTAGHEGVDQGEHEVRREECGGVVTSAEAGGDVEQGGDCGDHHTEVGDGQAEEVHVHHTLQVGSGEDNQAGEVAEDSNSNNDVGNNGVGDPFDIFYCKCVLK